jgi:hypothetical protein
MDNETNSTIVDSVLADLENTPDIINNEEILSSILTKSPAKKIKKAKKAKVAKVLATVETSVESAIPAPVVPVTPVITETPKVAKVKGVIDVNAIQLPTGVKLEIKKSFAKFSSDTRKTVLKGSSVLEFSLVRPNADTRYKVLTAEEIQKGHLGSMKAILRGVKDLADLQIIINEYFAA